MKRCQGCYYNLCDETNENLPNFDTYGCGQANCSQELQMFDIDSNYEPKIVSEYKDKTEDEE